jgi:hypothetical protein
MKEIVWVYYAAIVVATVGFLAFFIPDQPRPTPSDCMVAEIAPDMSVRDREVCRQLRQHRHRM